MLCNTLQSCMHWLLCTACFTQTVQLWQGLPCQLQQLPCTALPGETYCRCLFRHTRSAVQIWSKPIYTCLVDMQALWQFHLKPPCQTYRSNLAMILSSHPSTTLESAHMPRHSALNRACSLYMVTVCKSTLPEMTALVCSQEGICSSTTRLAYQLLRPWQTSPVLAFPATQIMSAFVLKISICCQVKWPHQARDCHIRHCLCQPTSAL